ncbi:hypothetical protein T08_11860 [Trichinella sp. T8]|nr:hypothetical protein T08_11860 [Trichinella sp. T8]
MDCRVEQTEVSQRRGKGKYEAYLYAECPRRRLRLCPRANKNLHIPAGYAQSILLDNMT